MNRGRRATFPPESNTSDDTTAAAIVVADPRRFAVRTDTGSEFIVDMTAWSHTSFVAEIAPLLQEYIRQMGPTPIERSVQRKVLHLRRFWSFLDARELAVRRLGDITVRLIND